MKWQTKKLGEVCEIIAGQSPEGCFYNKDGDGLPFYQGKKEFGEKFIKLPVVWSTKITKEAKENDILMCVRAPVGPINFATEKSCIGRGLAIIRAGKEIDKNFLFYFLFFNEEKITGNTGAVFASISKKDIADIRISLPPLAEQKRIVKILDEVFEGIKLAKENTEKNLRNSKELFESYLQSVFAKPGKDWSENSLKNLTLKIGSGATPRGGKTAYKKEGISLIRSMNVHDRCFKDKNLAFIDNKQANDLSNVTLEKGDILLNITGASVARCCVFPEKYLPARVNQHVSIIRSRREKINYRFLNFLLTSKFYKDQLLKIGEQGATRQAITKAQLENLIIAAPNSLSEQKAIVAKLEALAAETGKLEGIYRRKLADLGELKKSVLRKAFSGEL
jgi:type I restriction enzyme S subunit